MEGMTTGITSAMDPIATVNAATRAGRASARAEAISGSCSASCAATSGSCSVSAWTLPMNESKAAFTSTPAATAPTPATSIPPATAARPPAATTAPLPTVPKPRLMAEKAPEVPFAAPERTPFTAPMALETTPPWALASDPMLNLFLNAAVAFDAAPPTALPSLVPPSAPFMLLAALVATLFAVEPTDLPNEDAAVDALDSAPDIFASTDESAPMAPPMADTPPDASLRTGPRAAMPATPDTRASILAAVPSPSAASTPARSESMTPEPEPMADVNASTPATTLPETSSANAANLSCSGASDSLHWFRARRTALNTGMAFSRTGSMNFSPMRLRALRMLAIDPVKVSFAADAESP